MNPDQTIALYQSVADTSAQMLAAARNSDWERLSSLEDDCASQVRRLDSAEDMGIGDFLDPHFLKRKETLVQTILANDCVTRLLAEREMAKLTVKLNQANVERQLSVAYGSSLEARA